MTRNISPSSLSSNSQANNDANHPVKGPLFGLGRLVATPGALKLFESAHASIQSVLARHVAGDWQHMDAEDAQSNRDALRTGARVFSSFSVHGETVWVITEAINDATGQRDSTCVLLPQEY